MIVSGPDNEGSLARVSGWRPYFEDGGTFQRVSGSSGLLVRRYAKNLTAYTEPGATLRIMGGAAANLGQAFSNLSGANLDIEA
ncbi:MAG: hypothetical protein CMJ18_15230 [Phycisphaeraceae bacterium]|nr:hypothetical protein [Phycisphaeraceae bacterium]